MLKKLFYLLFIGLLLGFSYESFAQKDTEFWFAAPDNVHEPTNGNIRDRPILFRITSFGEEAHIIISQPANPAFNIVEDIIPANGTVTYDLTEDIGMIECQPANTIVNYGILIQSSNPVTAYYENSSVSNPDIYTLKGRNGIGLGFIVPSQTDFNQRDYTGVVPNSFLVVATEDDTHVQIIPKKAIVGHAAGISFEIVLNKGEVYVANATGLSANNHLGGTIVSADKAVALVVNDDSVDPAAPDLMADQSIPNELLGNNYIVVKGSFSDGGIRDRVYIFAAYDNTQVYREGSLIGTINKGNSVMFQFSSTDQSTYIESTEPVLVYHMSGYSGQPGAAVIPPIECTGSNITAFTRSIDDLFEIIVFTQTGNEGFFEINGNPDLLKASDFHNVPGTSGAWKATKKNMNVLATGSANIIENSNGLFHLGTINGTSQRSCRYGFFSNFASLNLGPDIAFCKGDTILLDAGTGQDTYAWYKYTAPTIVIGTESTIEVSDTGKYFCVATYEMCTPSDTIHLAWHADPMPNLGPDTTACLGTPVVFYPGTFSAYEWFDGSTSSTLSCDTAKLIWVKVFDSFGCHNSDTTEMFLYPQPVPVPIFHD